MASRESRQAAIKKAAALVRSGNCAAARRATDADKVKPIKRATAFVEKYADRSEENPDG